MRFGIKIISAVLVVAFLTVTSVVSHAANDKKTYIINIGATASPETSQSRAIEEFIKIAEKESNGRLKVTKKFGGVLGGEREMAEALQLGNLEMASLSDVGLGTVVPDISYVLLPYLFQNYAQVDKYYFNGFVGEDVKAKLLKKGIRLLAFMENDFRALTNSKRPVSSVSDLKGMKIRVPELPLFLSLFTKLGTSPTPMAVTELATALQQKTVDGQDNGAIITYSYGYYQLQKYMTITNHMYSGGGLLVSEKFWKTLPDDLKPILVKGAKAYSDKQIKMNRDDVKGFMQKIQAAGVQVTYLTPEQNKEFVTVGRQIWTEYEGKYGKAWIEKLKATVK